ncbi:PR-1-like protein, partial [Wolfiporia cocos MD-104 SS10]
GTSDAQEYLDTHNYYRAQHNASALQWSSDLVNLAQQYASSCQFANPDGALGAVGTNLAAGTGTFSATAAVGLFMSDESSYSPENPTYSHFTQVVWKDSTQLGCASALCDSIFDLPATYHVCVYNPVGNVVG